MDCSYDGCDRKAITKGWCGKHYMRMRRHGDPDVLLRSTSGKRGPNKRPPATCSVKECERPATGGRGWCKKHYLRWRRTGSPDVVRRAISQDGPLATFHANVDQREPDECWPWKRPPMKAGYGQIQWLDGKVWYAHRVAYVLAYGDIPVSGDPDDPIEIDHLCHDHRVCPETIKCQHRLCCNPAHLEAKPRSANTARTMFWRSCPPGCACGRHSGHSGSTKCQPGCSCGKHRRPEAA